MGNDEKPIKERIFVRKLRDGAYEARLSLSVIGISRMDEEHLRACGYDPFHPDFSSQFVNGIGKTEAEATYRLHEKVEIISTNTMEIRLPERSRL